MAKFEPTEGELTDIEIRLECLRLATEFGGEFQRQKPLPQAEEYFNWVKQNSKKITRKEPSKKKV